MRRPDDHGELTGVQAGFEETLEDVEAAMPGILDAVTERGSAA